MTIELSGARAFQEQLDALAKKFAQDYRNGDADACAMAYSEDGMRIEPGMPPFVRTHCNCGGNHFRHFERYGDISIRDSAVCR